MQVAELHALPLVDRDADTELRPVLEASLGAFRVTDRQEELIRRKAIASRTDRPLRPDGVAQALLIPQRAEVLVGQQRRAPPLLEAHTM